MKDISFFLGANTCRGFYSLYDEYISDFAPERLFILKGGAGCGKSGFMRRIAERAAAVGEPVERILCSGDPDSLDGVCLPGRRIAFFDGTSPHVLEPNLVGQTGFYIDLSRFYTRPAEGLERREHAYKEHYRRAYLWLSAAGSVDEMIPLSADGRDAVCRRARAFAERSLRRLRRERGGAVRRFTDAFTCFGSVTLSGTRRAAAPQLIALTGGAAAADAFLQNALECALSRGYDAIVCPDPLKPERIAHLLLPAAGLGVTVGEGDRRIHLGKLAALLTDEEKAAEREAARLRDSLIGQAQRELSLAKADHDRLEACVNPLVDFESVYRLADEYADRLFSL